MEWCGVSSYGMSQRDKMNRAKKKIFVIKFRESETDTYLFYFILFFFLHDSVAPALLI